MKFSNYCYINKAQKLSIFDTRQIAKQHTVFDNFKTNKKAAAVDFLVFSIKIGYGYNCARVYP